MNLETLVFNLPGVGTQRAKKLEKLGIVTVQDLLLHFPRTYDDRSQIYTIAAAPLDTPVCVQGVIAAPPQYSFIRKGMELVKVALADGCGVLQVTFFNQSYVKNTLKQGQEYTFYGAIEEKNNRRTMVNPIFEQTQQAKYTGRIMPIYPLTQGISNHMLASLVMQALENLPAFADCLPVPMQKEYSLWDYDASLRSLHFPDSMQDLQRARYRLIFEELFLFSLGLEKLKQRRTHLPAPQIAPQNGAEFLALLPFAPTAAQMRVMDEISGDLSNAAPMNRLVQGDVGSGKTILAAFGAWLTVKSQMQCAMMAPTEVLARQHYKSLCPLFQAAGIEVALLVGSLSAKEKRQIYARLSAGEIQFIIGTHALLSQGVIFQNLALVITDEQQRFGVAQRAALAEKSGGETACTPHTLILSATPIPRTLALIIYGDLEVSVLDELPAGRTPIETYLVGEDKRQRFYKFIDSHVSQGRQGYIVCPAVQEGEQVTTKSAQLKAVNSYAAQLQQTVFPHLKVASLHGQMPAKKKEEVMAAFVRGEIDILVSTTVIEVGVDVANAVVMLIENADRFGLSQLHQLRGRVGRGEHQSYCILTTTNRNAETIARLKAFTKTTDGFLIAQADLSARGPGDFFGNRQHGLPQFRLANLAQDTRVLHLAQQAARQVISKDPMLEQTQHRAILEKVKTLFSDTPEIFN